MLTHSPAGATKRNRLSRNCAKCRSVANICRYLFAVVYAGLGDKDQTFAGLNKEVFEIEMLHAQRQIPWNSELRPLTRSDKQFVGPLQALVRIERIGVPYGSRTRVAAVKGRCPRPLDERDARCEQLYSG